MIGLLIALASLDVLVRGDKSLILTLYREWQSRQQSKEKLSK